MSMTILDWVIFGLLVLAAIFGLIKGIKGTLSKKLGWLGGFVIATLFSAMLANFLLNRTPLGEWGMDKFNTIILDKAKDDSENLSYLNINYQEALADSELGPNIDSTLASCLGVIGVPKYFASFFISKIYYTGGTISQALGSGIFAEIAYWGTYVILYFVSSIILVAIFKWALGVKKGEGKGLGDRLMGMLVKVLEMGLSIFTVALVVTTISIYVEPLNTWLIEQTSYNSGSVTISGFFYKYAWEIINMFKLSLA